MNEGTNAQTNEQTNEGKPKGVTIFCDFDGTISSKDIGFDLFDRYGEQYPLHDQLLEGRLNIRDYWRQIVQTLTVRLNDEFLDEYLSTIPPDPGYAGLLRFVQEEKIPFTIVSDGISIYIKHFLRLYDFPEMPLYCNRGAYDADGILNVSFPYAADGCDCRSAVCKRNVLLAQTTPGDRIIYIGDGLSDFCPAECADVIFAKGSLAAYCNENGLPHHSWKNLIEVRQTIQKLLKKGSIPSRRQAELERKRSWERG